MHEGGRPGRGGHKGKGPASTRGELRGATEVTKPCPGLGSKAATFSTEGPAGQQKPETRCWSECLWVKKAGTGRSRQGQALTLARPPGPVSCFHQDDRNHRQASGTCWGLQTRSGGTSFGVTQIWVQIPALTPNTHGLGPATSSLCTVLCSSAKPKGQAGLPHRVTMRQTRR